MELLGVIHSCWWKCQAGAQGGSGREERLGDRRTCISLPTDVCWPRLRARYMAGRADPGEQHRWASGGHRTAAVDVQNRKQGLSGDGRFVRCPGGPLRKQGGRKGRNKSWPSKMDKDPERLVGRKNSLERLESAQTLRQGAALEL